MNPGEAPPVLGKTNRWLAAGFVLAVFAVAAFGQVSPPATAGRLVNFSARAGAGAGNDTLIAGFVVAGSTPKPFLVRAVGPTLANFGVSGALGDPVLSLNAGGVLLSSNDDWGAAANASQLLATAAGVGAFPLVGGSRDAVLLPTLASGTYNALVTTKLGAVGVALVEIYDTTSADGSQVVNFSARAQVGGAGGPLIGGFVIDGTAPRLLLIRGVGPTLTSLGLPGAMTDPQMSLFRSGTAAALQQNDNWGGAAKLKTAFGATGAFPLSDTSKDAVLLVSLDPGAYSVQMSGVGSATGLGLLEIYDATATAAAPAIVAPPTSLNVGAGTTASLTVVVSSQTPATYQWRKDGAAIAGATADTLMLPDVQSATTGTYTVTVSNVTGSVTSAPVTVSLTAPPSALPPANTFDLVGFATKGTGTTGGGILALSDPNYHVLDASIANKAAQLRTWLESTTAVVVDIQADVDLGALNNVSNRPKTNPELITSGLGVINIRANKTVFSSTGATLRHGMFNLSGQNNIIVRNLRFRGLWEFDEGSQNAPDNAPWGYKIQDWDYVTVQGNARNVWIDHCDFEKAYDGLADTKNGADLVTYSWCRLGGDTEGAVARQVAYLEKLYQGEIADGRITYTFYKGLRDGIYAAQGIPRQSVQDIIAHELPHDKCNLVGAADTTTTDIGFLNVTFHHMYYRDCRQRLPRMRFGNAHVFNLFVDNSGIADGTNMGTATTCDAAVFAENNYYQGITDPFPPISGTSPPGRITQTGSKWIFHGVDTSLASNTFLKDPATWTWNTGTKNFTWSVAPAPNAKALPYSYQADPVDYTQNNLPFVGVIVPANAADRATLAGYLVKTTH